MRRRTGCVAPSDGNYVRTDPLVNHTVYSTFGPSTSAVFISIIVTIVGIHRYYCPVAVLEQWLHQHRQSLNFATWLSLHHLNTGRRVEHMLLTREASF